MALHKVDKEVVALARELGQVEVFAGLGDKALQALAATGRVVHLPAGWAVIAENTPADSVYLLLDGETEVRQGDEVIARLGPGALVGEAALVDRRRRNASVITLTPLRALRLAYDDTPALFTKHADVEDVFRREWDKKVAAESSY